MVNPLQIGGHAQEGRSGTVRGEVGILPVIQRTEGR